MWNSFEGALEKRVRSPKNIKADKYIILKSAKKVLGNTFGVAGRENIEVLDLINGKLKVKIKRSIWRSEVSLQKEKLVKLINQEIGQDELTGILINN